MTNPIRMFASDRDFEKVNSWAERISILNNLHCWFDLAQDGSDPLMVKADISDLEDEMQAYMDEQT